MSTAEKMECSCAGVRGFSVAILIFWVTTSLHNMNLAFDGNVPNMHGTYTLPTACNSTQYILLETLQSCE